MTETIVEITDPQANKAMDSGSESNIIVITSREEPKIPKTCWNPEARYTPPRETKNRLIKRRDPQGRTRIVGDKSIEKPATHELTPHCTSLCRSPHVQLESKDNLAQTYPLKSRYHRIVDPFEYYDEASFELQGESVQCIVCSKPTKRKNSIHLACMIANLRRCKICRQYSVNNWSTCALCQKNTNQWLMDDQLHFNHCVAVLKKRLAKERPTLPGGVKENPKTSKSTGEVNKYRKAPVKRTDQKKPVTIQSETNREQAEQIDATVNTERLWTKMKVAEDHNDIPRLNSLYKEFNENGCPRMLSGNDVDRFFLMEGKCLDYQIKKQLDKNVVEKKVVKKEKKQRKKQKNQGLQYTQKIPKHVPTSKFAVVENKNDDVLRVVPNDEPPKPQSATINPITIQNIIESEESGDSVLGSVPRYYNKLPHRGVDDGYGRSSSSLHTIDDNNSRDPNSETPMPDPSRDYHDNFDLKTLGRDHKFEHYDKRGGLDFEYYSLPMGSWIYSQTFDEYLYLGSNVVQLDDSAKHLIDKKFPSLASCDTILRFERRVTRSGLLNKVFRREEGPVDPEIKFVSVEMLSALMHHNLTNPHQSIETVFNKMEAHANAMSYVPYSRHSLAEGSTLVADTLIFAKHLHEKRTFNHQCFRFGQNAHGQGGDSSTATTLTTQPSRYRKISISTVLNCSLFGLILITSLRSSRPIPSSVIKMELTPNLTTEQLLGTWDQSVNESPLRSQIRSNLCSASLNIGSRPELRKTLSHSHPILTSLLKLGLKTLRTSKHASRNLLAVMMSQSQIIAMKGIHGLSALLRKSIMTSINNLGPFSTVLIGINATLGPLSMLLRAKYSNTEPSSKRYPYERDLFYLVLSSLIIAVSSLLILPPMNHTSIRVLWEQFLTG